jgi:hypothetical protein
MTGTASRTILALSRWPASRPGPPGVRGERARKVRLLMIDNLEWFALTDARMLVVAQSGPGEFGPGFERVRGYARDALDRPHDPAPRDLLLMECRQMADALLMVAQEDGNARFLGDALALLVKEIAGLHARIAEAAQSGRTSIHSSTEGDAK